MRNYHTWLLDLDDTLQIGPFSWAAIHIFPDIIKQTGIKPERALLDAAATRAEVVYDEGGSNEEQGQEFLKMLGWPVELNSQIIDRLAKEYKPELFADTLGFLDWATARGDRLFVTANNKWARSICKMLGITHYFADILTPNDVGVTGKPTPGMWEYLKTHHGLTDDSDVVLVGNNMTTDGSFAKNCGLNCIIIDRYDRFTVMPEHCIRVTSFNDIPALLSQ